MSTLAVDLQNITKSYSWFQLKSVSLQLEQGQIMGFVGPNGAGKSTTIRILMGLICAEEGEARVLGHVMPEQQAQAKRDIGFVSSDMALFGSETVAWHMDFIRSIYPGWDPAYANKMIERFALHPRQQVKSLSQGERVKVLLLLVLARRPRLLVLDEPTTGLDPVARHEMLTELMDVLQDEERSILFSSHNTVDVEQISDSITFIDRGRIIDSSDKESFMNGWRRLKLDLPTGGDAKSAIGAMPGIIDISGTGHVATVTTNVWTPQLQTLYEQVGATVHEVQRMTLEEVFVANVMHSRKRNGE